MEIRKKIRISLLNENAYGGLEIKISNWNGIAYKIPRDILPKYKSSKEFSKSGVYFLFGDNNFYVGQAEVRQNGKGILQRILDHDFDKKKKFWDEAVIFTTNDNSLGKTEISYLESSSYRKASLANRYHIQNSVTPNIGTVTPEKKDELEEYMELLEFIIVSLGYKCFQPKKIDKASEKEIHKKNGTVNGIKIPKLPNKNDTKIGEYIRTAMRRLSESGYSFSIKTIDEMCSPEWSKKHFHTVKPFMKHYIAGKTDNKDTNGKYVRFWEEIFSFGKAKVYISKEWYERQFTLFTDWYSSIK